jgi:DNA gyrase subunit B
MGQPSRYTADDIQVLEGLEAVRLRPAMYIGDTSTRGLHHLFYEVIDNSIDEVLNGYCTDIVVTLGKDQIVTVEDNGRGIPIDMHPETGRPGLEVAMTMLHAGGKFGGSGYKVSGGLHGVGVSVVNALSEWCEVTVMRDGKQCRQRYERGVPAGDMEQTGKTKRTGTITSYLADSQIFGEFQHDPEHFVSRIRELAYLNKGVKITFINETAGEDEEREQVFQYRTGLAAYVEHLNRNKSSLHRPVYFAKERDGIDIEVAIQYNETFQDLILTFANNIRTVEGGTHLSGFKTALTRVLNQYARKQGILKEKDRNFSGDDVREGITAVISVKLLSPQFEGQTKTKLGNSEVEGVVNSVVGEGLGTYLEEHPSVGKRVCEKAITASRARDAARKASELVKRQSALEASSLPGRLADCSEKDPMKCELYIVEGESGGGTAKSGRDRRFQAILPLRGKVLNVEKARIDKALSNEEIRSLITARTTTATRM